MRIYMVKRSRVTNPVRAKNPACDNYSNFMYLGDKRPALQAFQSSTPAPEWGKERGEDLTIQPTCEVAPLPMRNAARLKLASGTAEVSRSRG